MPFKITDKRSGKSYSYPGSVAPDKNQARQFIYDQEHKSTWAKLNEPLSDLPSRMAHKVSDSIETDNNSPYNAYWQGMSKGVIDAVGDMASSFTSPFSLGLTALTAGSGTAARFGLGGAARGLNAVERAAGAGMAAHGGYRLSQARDLEEAGSALTETAGGLLGARAKIPSFAESTPRPGVSRKALPAARTPARFASGADGIIDRQRPLKFDPNIPIEGEVLPAEPRQLKGSVNQKALPPVKQPYFGSRRGMSPDVNAVSEPTVYPKTPQEGAFNALIPNRYKPVQSNMQDMPPHEFVPQASSEAYTGTGKLEDFNAPRARPESAPVGKTGFEKVPDSDIEFMAEQGDKSALAEARKRPGIWERLKSRFQDETGAVGPGADDLIKKRAAQRAEERRRIDTGAPKGMTDRRQDQLLTKFGGQADTDITAAIKTLRDAGVPETTLGKYTKEQIISNAQRMKTEGGFFKIGGGEKDKYGRSFARRMMSPVKGTPYEQDFSGWVNKRKASNVEGTLRGREFKDLDELGVDGIHAYQSGSRTGRLKDVADYFDKKHAELTDKGVRVDYRENYLPQIWEDSPDKVKDVYRRLGLRPSFTLKRIFDDYAAGINAGLKPKFKNISELVGWYESKANKAIADREFYQTAKDKGWIKPQGKGNPDWKILDANHFPAVRLKSKGRSEVKILPMTAPPEFAQIMKNYLGQPQEHLEAVANFTSGTKNLAMSAGVPYTAVNAHGFNILARTFMADPVRAFKAGKYMLNPKSAARDLESMLPQAPRAVRSGLSLTTEEHSLGSTASTNLGYGARTLQKVLSKTGPMFEDPLFQNMIPALKLKHWQDMTGDIMKQGKGREAAEQMSSEYLNSIYGGMNWEAMGRSRDIQNLSRTFILAPDWLESNVRMGKGMAKALKDPKSPIGRAYVKSARNIMAGYVAANVLNYASSGHLMHENAPGHSLDIELGKDSNGKIRWFRPFGTAADFLRLPLDVASAATKFSPGGKYTPNLGVASEIAKNRLSTTASPAINLLTKRDRFGRPIMGRDDYGRPMSAEKQLGGIAGELSSAVTPPYIKGAIDYGTGRVSGEEALMGSVESPMRYSSQPRLGSGRTSRTRRRVSRK